MLRFFAPTRRKVITALLVYAAMWLYDVVAMLVVFSLAFLFTDPSDAIGIIAESFVAVSWSALAFARVGIQLMVSYVVACVIVWATSKRETLGPESN